MRKIFLLADDDNDDRELFSQALSQVDPSITCYCAADGKEVMDKLESNEFLEPDLIFLDINMPGMSGWDCLRKLKESEQYKHIRVIIYSTSAHQRDADTAIELGALCFFTKPDNYNQLKNILAVIAANIEGDILAAVSQYENIKVHKIFACS